MGHTKFYSLRLKKYKFTVNTWRFLKDWVYVTGFTTNDFRNLKFYYQAPSKVENWSEALVQVVETSEFDDLEYNIAGLDEKNTPLMIKYKEVNIEGYAIPLIEKNRKDLLRIEDDDDTSILEDMKSELSNK